MLIIDIYTALRTNLRQPSRETYASSPANVNLTDLRRVIRAHQSENVPFRVVLQPNGAAVFESGNTAPIEQSAYDQWKSENSES
jgi:hypothetical protein